MGSLPQCRVTLDYPFKHTGVDFTGHVMIKRTPRGVGLKAYVCIFVCMASKAVHLEVVTTLSSQGFLSAFRRFIARRTTPAHMYSDNGTNFVGGAKELQRLFSDHNVQKEVVDFSSPMNITWHFNPPSAPHHGGLWEAEVKSFKHHFKRVIGSTVLTYEELNTVVVQIEATLNSRPLVAVQDKPGDIHCLTPGDFLHPKAPTQLPVAQDMPNSVGYVRRWHLCTKLRDDLLRRWKSEYLHTLQQRHRWNLQHPDISPKDVVLLKQEAMGNVDWPMGIVEEVYPAKGDGHVRVAQVWVKGKSILRPITKLVKLPIYQKVE
ncbi:uncharacterized protein LOC129787350 [Lutzomyia longipalpis]|uniref:uncharacterized protein LOC129787350 n=1 Tax=Lutzomyia longipalpis TaxID=7200 RepID=UPI0024837E8E|nr:uncharacterized protein LOC129787350 [Lutzomyia longipalpis]